MLNGYIALWKGGRVEVYAETLYAAKVAAIAKIEKEHRPRGTKWKDTVSVHLAETNVDPATLKGEQVIHVATT